MSGCDYSVFKVCRTVGIFVLCNGEIHYYVGHIVTFFSMSVLFVSHFHKATGRLQYRSY